MPTSVPLVSPVEPPLITNCPTCLRQLKRPHKCKELYRVRVCNKCRAGFANRREIAYIVDCVLYRILLYATMTAVSAVAGMCPPNLEALIDILVILLVWIGLPFLFLLKDGMQGQSPGKRLCGIQVVDAVSREPIGWRQSLKRNLIFMLPLIGSLGALITLMKGNRWGEGWARTEVVWLKYKTRPPFAPASRYCRNCGYDLTGNVTGRCPECGHDILPDQAIPVAYPADTIPPEVQSG